MGMLDISSVFPEVSNTALQDRDTQQMIGWQGLQNLAQRSLANANQQVRGGLFQATGREGVLSPEMQMNRAIGAYSENPEAPGADATLLEATRRWAPDRVPELMKSMETKRQQTRLERRQDEADQRQRNADQRAATAAAEATQRHNIQMEESERLKGVARSNMQAYRSLYRNERWRGTFEEAGITEDFLNSTTDPTVIENALSVVQDMTAQEHNVWRQERERVMAELEDSSREAIADMVNTSTAAFGDAIENGDSLYLKTLQDVMVAHPTAQNYSAFMSEFGRQENANKMFLRDLAAQAAADSAIESYTTTEAEIDDAMGTVFGQLEEAGALQWKYRGNNPFRSTNQEINRKESFADMPAPARRVMESLTSRARNVIELGSVYGKSPNDRDTIRMAVEYARGNATEEDLALWATGRTPNTQRVSQAQANTISLDEALNVGPGNNLPDPTGFGVSR
jgi:hypothetical protein